MKKVLSFILVFILILSTLNFASGFQDLTGTFFVRDNGSLARDEWVYFDKDGDGYDECFHFNEFGFLERNVITKDGYKVDENGYYIENGKIYKVKSKNPTIINPAQNSQTSITPTETKANNNNNVVIANGGSSFDTKKKLINNIQAKSGVQTYDTKKVCGKSWVEVISLSGNDSYIKTNSGNFNCLSLECGINAPKDTAQYTLSFYAGSELIETFDDFGSEPETIEVFFDPNTNLMIVYNATAEEGSYLSTDSKMLYIRNAKFSNKQER